jgi:prevent-host-death family protein
MPVRKPPQHLRPSASSAIRARRVDAASAALQRARSTDSGPVALAEAIGSSGRTDTPIGFSEARRRLAELIRRAHDEDCVFRVTNERNLSAPAAVVMSAARWERTEAFLTEQGSASEPRFANGAEILARRPFPHADLPVLTVDRSAPAERRLRAGPVTVAQASTEAG